MPKLFVLKSTLVAKALERAGFILARQNGSHRIYKKEIYAVTVPMHATDLKKGTLKNILKQAGMTAKEFGKYL